MIYVALFLMCILVIETSNWLGMMAHVRAIISRSQFAIESILSKNISDVEKEKTARTSSQAILKDTFFFALKFGMAICIVLIPYFAIIQLTDISSEEFADVLFSWGIVVTLSIFSIAYIKIRYGHPK